MLGIIALMAMVLLVGFTLGVFWTEVKFMREWEGDDDYESQR